MSKLYNDYKSAVKVIGSQIFLFERANLADRQILAVKINTSLFEAQWAIDNLENQGFNGPFEIL